MHFILKYVQYIQINNPTTPKTPYDILSKLFYENSLKDPLIKFIKNRPAIIFEEELNNFKNSEIFDSIIKNSVKIAKESNHLKSSILGKETLMTDETILSQIHKRIDANYNNLIRVDQNEKNIFNKEFAIKTILNDRSSPFFKFEIKDDLRTLFFYLKHNNNQQLIDILKFVNDVYIEVFDYYIKNENEIKSPILQYKFQPNQIAMMVSHYKQGISLLKQLNVELEDLKIS